MKNPSVRSLPAILPPLSRLSVAAYFILLGLGYLLIEIAVLQRVILFTGQPVLAASIVFAIFLIGSGVGSATAPEARTRRAALRMFAAIGMGLAIAATALWLATDLLFEPPQTSLLPRRRDGRPALDNCRHLVHESTKPARILWVSSSENCGLTSKLM